MVTDDHTVLTTVCAKCLAVLEGKAAAYDNAEREWRCTITDRTMPEPMGDCVPPTYDEQHGGCGWVRVVREIGDTDE